MKFAAIDIGSNAARLQISRVLTTSDKKIDFKKVEYVRFPLRLGLDVFTMKRITPKRENNLMKLLHSYKLLMELHEVDDYLMFATSAMREAENGEEIREKVQATLGLNLQIISGDQESEFVNKAFKRSIDQKNYLHIDVGGGSTELTLFSEQKQIVSRSFPIGSIRLLENTVDPEIWKEMHKWIDSNGIKDYSKLVAVGIGGNINKIASIVGAKNKTVQLKEIESLQKKLEDTTLEERINDYSLNPDRADVILPASNIYQSVMKWAKIKDIIVPGFGLKDGIMEALVDKYHLEEIVQKGISLSGAN